MEWSLYILIALAGCAIANTDEDLHARSVRAVPVKGCLYNGKRYNVGAVMFTDNTLPAPCYKLVCARNGQATKTDIKCPGNGCADNYPQCKEYNAKGHCEKYKDWMKTNCKKSCNHCAQGGCTHKGKTYKVGQVIENKNTFPLPCHQHYCTEKGVQKRSTKCIGSPQQGDDGSSLCHIRGDPHYRTFDAYSWYDYMGPCEYYVVKACNSFPGGATVPAYAKWFITAQHEFWYTTTKTNIKYITIHVPKFGPPFYDTINIGKFGNGINVQINNEATVYTTFPTLPTTFTYAPVPTFTFGMTGPGGYLEITNPSLTLKIHYKYRDVKIWLDNAM